MTALDVSLRPAVPAGRAAIRRPLLATAVRWVFATTLPQLFVILAGAAYLMVIGRLLNPPAFDEIAKLPNLAALLIGLAVIHVVSAGVLRGMVLRQFLPQFPMLLWCAVSILFSAIMLVFAAIGSASGIGTSLLIALPDFHMPPMEPEVGLASLIFGFFVVAEIIGVIVAGIPGLVVGAIEALVLRRAARGLGGWIIWTGVAWSAVVIPIGINSALAWAKLPLTTLAAAGVAAPIAMGVIVALLTLPAVMNLKPR